MATSILKRAWFPAAVSLLLCLLVFGILWTYRAAGKLVHVECEARDLLIGWEPKDNTFASKILIVGINEKDIQKLGYPIPDSTRADLLEKLQALNAAEVGFDLIGDRPVGDAAGSQRLADDFAKSNGSVVGVLLFRATDVAVNGPRGLDPSQVGFAEIVVDRDDVARRAMIAANELHSFNLLMAIYYLGAIAPDVQVGPDPANPNLLKIGPTTLRKFYQSDGAYIHEEDQAYQYLLDFRGPESFPRVSLLDVLEGRVSKADVDGKAVLIGMTTNSVKDYVDTPIKSRQFGVEFQAVCVDQLLRAALRGAHPIGSWSDPTELIWTLAWALAGGLLSFSVRSFWKITIAAVAGIVVLIGFAYFMIHRGIWIPLVPPAIAWSVCITLISFYMAYNEKEDRTMLRELFSRHVSRAVVDEVWSKREQFFADGRIPGSEITATVLFTDLKGFTSLSLTMPAGELMQWLNEYMEEMSQTVEEHGGFVNKYVGDAIMAIFGAPIPKDPAAEACAAVAAALAMRQRMAKLRPIWSGKNMPEICMRVGIMTGKLVVGSLGSQQRLEYTVIGDTVNTASRLESYDKNEMSPDIAADGCRIIIGQQTHEMVQGSFKDRSLGFVELKGREKEEKIEIFGVIE